LSKRVVVLGCGLVGSAMARDLSGEPDLTVSVADATADALASISAKAPVQTRRADLSDPKAIAEAVAEADAVVGALPGRLGHAMLDAVIRAGKSIADISFSPQDPLSLDALARERGVTAIVDCGVSPGLSNLAVGLAAAELARVEDVEILVGGLPEDHSRPGGYAIVFSAADVIEEYTRPARIVENGRITTRRPLSEVETFEIAEIGRLEGFLTDGLRTLLATVPAVRMREKTLRYPGHAAAMEQMRDCGFFADQPVTVAKASVVPRDFSIALLGRAWALRDGERELTYMRVTVSGARSDGARTRRRFELLDRTDRESGMTSMARTTGLPCAAMAAALARGEYRRPGVHAPEALGGDPATAAALLTRLNRRGVRWTDTTEQLS
jgi:saccharopine dehydrogenase-like NADP-dependent oxidoreductase